MAETAAEPAKSNISEMILKQFRQLSKEFEEAPLAKFKERGQKRKLGSNEKTDSDNIPRHCGLSEANVFITEYISKTNGFKGILKHRFSDFQVNEIDLEGNVVELTSLKIPEDKPMEKEEPENVKSVLREDEWKTIDEILNSQDKSMALEIDVTTKTKEERNVIHSAIKSVYGLKVCSNTVTNGDKKILRVTKCTKSQDRMSWPKGRGKYLHFTLHKENIDITEAVNTLAKLLRTKPNNITYAGTKDKRAKTTQRMCVNLRPAELLAKHNMRSLTVGNFSYHDKPLHLGHLSGNRFKVAIRDVNGDDEDVTKAMDSLSKFGFINYFGLQRFGSSASVPTHMIGKAILSADWKLAVELILKPREGERGFKDLKAAREEWWKSKNPAKAVKCLSKHDRSIEGKVLQTLKSQGSNAYCNAIFTIPRNTLMLYVHAYQSLIWNKIVSRRIKEFGLKPIAGDLVIDDSGTNGEDDKVDSSEDEETNGDEEEIDAVVQEKSDSKASDYKRPIVKLLTKEDLETTPIDRIVYPMPGHDVVYPDNAIASWYTEALSEDNLTPENFKSTHKVFSVFGTYRNLLGRVENLEWRTVGYQNFNDDLILSDLDKLKNKELPEMPEDCQFKAIIMEFSLKPSTYATMVLREVMKCETSGSHHAALTIANHSENSENKKCKLSDS